MTLRSRLRSETRAAHDRVDACFGRLNLTAVDELAHFLSAHHVALQALEPLMRERGLSISPPVSRLGQLEADLKALNRPVPNGRALPVLAGKNGLGLIYVNVGSHLGAKVLQKKWAKADNPIVQRAGCYLSASDLAPYWQQFLAAISEIDPESEFADDCVASANAAFQVFEDAYHMTRQSYDEHVA